MIIAIITPIHVNKRPPKNQSTFSPFDNGSGSDCSHVIASVVLVFSVTGKEAKLVVNPIIPNNNVSNFFSFLLNIQFFIYSC